MVNRCIAVFCICVFSAGFAWTQVVSSDVNASVSEAAAQSRVSAAAPGTRVSVRAESGGQGSGAGGNAYSQNSRRAFGGDLSAFSAAHKGVAHSTGPQRHTTVSSAQLAGRQFGKGMRAPRPSSSSFEEPGPGASTSPSGQGHSSSAAAGQFPDTTRYSYWPTPPFWGPPTSLSFAPKSPLWAPRFGDHHLALSYRVGSALSGIHHSRKLGQSRIRMMPKPVDPLSGLDGKVRSGLNGGANSGLTSGLPQDPLDSTLSTSNGGN